MIASALSYLRCSAHCLARSDERRLLSAHFRKPTDATASTEVALRRAITWLISAQDQTGDDGFGSYHLVDGWSASYPETTGYIIPTLLAAGAHLEWSLPKERALLAAEWLITIQRPDGGWQGGRVGEQRPSIVFNTAQVIRGLLAAHHATGKHEYLLSSVRAAEWIISMRSRDGAWRKNNFLGAARVYDSYVSAPLLRVFRLTGDERFKHAAESNLEWVLAQQWTNGWFSNCDNTIKHNDRPITHTIAYTIDGLIECSAHVEHDRLITQARKAADALLEIFLRDGWLNGRYDDRWRGSESLITTGCAQMAICWSWLARLTGENRYSDGAQRMTRALIAMQELNMCGPPAVHGALSGSYPLWGRYEKFAFPNWGTKYFADALLCADGKLPMF